MKKEIQGITTKVSPPSHHQTIKSNSHQSSASLPTLLPLNYANKRHFLEESQSPHPSHTAHLEIPTNGEGTHIGSRIDSVAAMELGSPHEITIGSTNVNSALQDSCGAQVIICLSLCCSQSFPVPLSSVFTRRRTSAFSPHHLLNSASAATAPLGGERGGGRVPAARPRPVPALAAGAAAKTQRGRARGDG